MGVAQGDLTFQAYGESNLTHPHPYPTADLGDTVVVTLTVPQSQITLKPGESFDQAYLTQATLIYPHGIIVQTGLAAEPNYVEQIHSRTRPMLMNHPLSATPIIFENWAGFPPPQPPATNVGVYPLETKWTANVVYTVTTHGEACNAQGTNCQPTTTHTQKVQAVPGTSWANMVITGTDWYIIPVAIDSGTQ